VLSTTLANDTDPLTAAQTAALVQGIDVLAQRLTQIQTTGLFGKEAAGLGESIGTLSPIGDQLRTGLAERLASLSGAITVLDVKNAFLSAAAVDPVQAISSVTATVETGLADQARLWFAVPITGSTPLPDYTLNLGQAPATAGSPSLFDQGLKLGDVKATVSVGYEGTLEFGIDLAPGLTTDQSFFIKFGGLDVVAKATATGASAVQDVEANFGIIKLGPADLDVSLDSRVRIDLQEGSDGVVALGELDGTAVADLGSLFSLSAAGTGLSVRVPFVQNLRGLQQAVGSAQEITIKATDLFDPSSLSLTLPSLKLADGITAFDFTKLAGITASDVGPSWPTSAAGCRSWAGASTCPWSTRPSPPSSARGCSAISTTCSRASRIRAATGPSTRSTRRSRCWPPSWAWPPRPSSSAGTPRPTPSSGSCPCRSRVPRTWPSTRGRSCPRACRSTCRAAAPPRSTSRPRSRSPPAWRSAPRRA